MSMADDLARRELEELENARRRSVQPAGNGSEPSLDDDHVGEYVPPSDDDFWGARPILEHIRNFARARRAGPWATLAVVMARAIAATPQEIVLPPIAGGTASLNLYVGIVGTSGGGKGVAEAAGRDAVKLNDGDVVTIGAGSGEGVAKLFYAWNKETKDVEQHTRAVIISVPEIDTLVALKVRQGSTLWPELRKAWMGEPLGFGYANSDKKVPVPRHGYRLCVITGVQPANAGPVLEDYTGGTPQRFLWLPASDPDVPAERPGQPEPWPNPLIKIGGAPTRPQQMKVCEAAWREVDARLVNQLREQGGDPLDQHRPLVQLKVAAALALLDGRRTEITEDDWKLAATVCDVSDRTRQQVINTLNRARTQANLARGHADAERASIVGNRLAEEVTKRVGRAILRKLDRLGGAWVPRSKLRKAAQVADRDRFDDALDALLAVGQVDERPIQTDRKDRQGTEYRRHQ
jgi:hypothetical protein